MLREILWAQGGERGRGWGLRKLWGLESPTVWRGMETDNRKQWPPEVRDWLDIVDGEEIQK